MATPSSSLPSKMRSSPGEGTAEQQRQQYGASSTSVGESRRALESSSQSIQPSVACNDATNELGGSLESQQLHHHHQSQPSEPLVSPAVLRSTQQSHSSKASAVAAPFKTSGSSGAAVSGLSGAVAPARNLHLVAPTSSLQEPSFKPRKAAAGSPIDLPRSPAVPAAPVYFDALPSLQAAAQPQAFQSHITMSMNLNITASSMNNSRPVVNISTKSGSGNGGGLSPSNIVYESSGLPPMTHVHSGGRKRKSSHGKKPTNNNKDKESVEKAPSSSGPSSSNSSSNAKSRSPFEKLNTLKLLLDCGHLTNEEYQERKNQIINEMTGTSTERKKPSPRRTLQPIMKTVVPHNPPDFGRLMKERAEKLSFDVDTLEWNSTSTRVKLDLVPFATGQLRNAYYLQELEEAATDKQVARLLVAKFSIRHAEPSSYLSDVEMQAVCAHYAELYNEHEPPLKVYYARSWLLKLRDRGDLVCSVEEYLPGAYVKYSNNNGYVGKETSSTEERERNTPQAFSHFTFVASDYRLMIVDIQGVNDSYTDPQIHTADGRGFGAGNLGTFGMEKFLESHRCNEVCKWLGLQSINERYKFGGTAAPLYQMPFGSAIKKSTNRITEERNTFSTSVTVSEAFGSDALKDAREDLSSTSESTVATGSSSMLYVQQHQLFASSSSSMRFGFDPNGPSSSGSKRSVGLAMKSGEVDDHGAAAWWQALKRLLCCCYTV